MPPKVLLIKRYILSVIPQRWYHFVHSRPATKFAHFHFFGTLVFAMHGVLSVLLYKRMLSPSPNSIYFDFRATPLHETYLGSGYGCSIQPMFPFAFWTNFSASLANYVLIAWLPLVAGILTLSMSAISLLLFVSYRHFGAIPRSRFINPRIRENFYARICKWLPQLLWIAWIGTAFCVATLLILVLFFNICNSKIVEVSRPLGRIKNCRLWVDQCAEDRRAYGRHLACSLPENYLAFPAEPCEPGANDPCVFPRSHGQHISTKSPSETPVTALSVRGGICNGEHVSDADGGPVPWCPMCTDARRDEKSGVYNSAIESNGRIREKTKPVQVTHIVKKSHNPREWLQSRRKSFLAGHSENPNSLAELQDEVSVQQHAGEENFKANVKPEKPTLASRFIGAFSKKRRVNKSGDASLQDGIPWPLLPSSSEAFYSAYMTTLMYFQEGSYAVRMVNIWSLTSLCVIGSYMVTLFVFGSLLAPDGYFTIPASSTVAGTTSWLVSVVFTKFWNLVTCGKFEEEKKHV